VTETKRGLRFSPGNHRYYLDGQSCPGVTTILGVLDKPGLRKWAAKTVAEYVADNPEGVEGLRTLGRDAVVATLKDVPWRARDKAAGRGTSFHDYAERIANGEAVDVPDELVPLVENCLRFMEFYDIEPLAIEGCVGSREHQYAGKFDMIADSKIGRAIWDYKSGKAIYPSTALQNSAYAHAEFMGLGGDEQPIPDVEASYGVHIRADGYSIIPLEFGPDVFAEFVVIRRAYDINKRVEGDWREPGSGYAGLPLEVA
jgi:hypothetical protein